MKIQKLNSYLFILLSVLVLSSCVVDECETIVCLNDGICENGTCECPVGFSGPTCAVVGTGDCADIACENGGTCISGACDCPDGFTGEFCQIEIQNDPCADIECENGGTCDDGTCDCPDNYEGTLCQSLEREKFIGSYDVTDMCSNGNFTYVMNISAGSSNDRVNISNLGNFGSNVTISATIDGTDIAFSDSDDGFTFVGDGFINQETLTFGYESSGGYSITCSSVGTKQ